MNGRNQPYLDTNGAGFYEPTMWQDEVEGIQEGTPVDEQNLNNIEDGVNGANLTAEFASGVTAPELAKALILYPDEPGKDYGGDYHWMNNAGERLPLAGGGWAGGACAGVFDLNLDSARSSSYSDVGFRSAYVEL